MGAEGARAVERRIPIGSTVSAASAAVDAGAGHAARLAGWVSVPDERYPDLHRLIERLEPEQAAQVREQILRLVTPPQGLRVLSVFDGPEEDLGQQSEDIIRSEAGEQ